jgi:hypothetical protein
VLVDPESEISTSGSEARAAGCGKLLARFLSFLADGLEGAMGLEMAEACGGQYPTFLIPTSQCALFCKNCEFSRTPVSQNYEINQSIFEVPILQQC